MVSAETFRIKISDGSTDFFFDQSDPNGCIDYRWRWDNNRPSEAEVIIDLAYDAHFHKIEEGWTVEAWFNNAVPLLEQYFKGYVSECTRDGEVLTVEAVDDLRDLANLTLNEVVFCESHLLATNKPGYLHEAESDLIDGTYVAGDATYPHVQVYDQDGNKFAGTKGPVSPIDVAVSAGVNHTRRTTTIINLLNTVSDFQKIAWSFFAPSSYVEDVWVYCRTATDGDVRIDLARLDPSDEPEEILTTTTTTSTGTLEWMKFAINHEVEKGGEYWLVMYSDMDPGSINYCRYWAALDPAQSVMREWNGTWSGMDQLYTPTSFITSRDEWTPLTEETDYEVVAGDRTGNYKVIKLHDTEANKWSTYPDRVDGFFKVSYYYHEDDLFVSDVVDKIARRAGLTPTISGDATTTKIPIATFRATKGSDALSVLADLSGSEFYMDNVGALVFQDKYEETTPEEYGFYNAGDSPTGLAPSQSSYDEIVRGGTKLTRKAFDIVNKVTVIGDLSAKGTRPPVAVVQSYALQTLAGKTVEKEIHDQNIKTFEEAFDRAKAELSGDIRFNCDLTVAGQYPWIVRDGFMLADSDVGLNEWASFKAQSVIVGPNSTRLLGTRVLGGIADELLEQRKEILRGQAFQSPLMGEDLEYHTACNTTSLGWTPDHCHLRDTNAATHGEADLELAETGRYVAFFDTDNGNHYTDTYILRGIKIDDATHSNTTNVDWEDMGQRFFKTPNMKVMVFFSLTGSITCGTTCETTCMTSCEAACMTTCELGCETGCESTCQLFCESTCQTTCEASCQGTCELACQSGGCETACQETCMSTCQTPCETCQTGCQLACQTACELKCQSACEVTCRSNCQVVCRTAIEEA